MFSPKLREFARKRYLTQHRPESSGSSKWYWIFTFVRSSDRRRINTICYFAWKSYTASRWHSAGFDSCFLLLVWQSLLFIIFADSQMTAVTRLLLPEFDANEETPARVCTSHLYLYAFWTQLCGGSAGTRGCCTSDRRQPWKSSWKKSFILMMKIAMF